MPHPRLLLLLVLGTSGCLAGSIRSGAEVQTPVRGGAVIATSLGIDGGHARHSAVGSLRFSGRFAEIGTGAEACARNVGWTSGIFCARAIVALGSDQREFTFGISPALSAGLWIPTRSRPKRITGSNVPDNIGKMASQNTEALEPTLSVGLHYRPLGPERAIPFAQLTFGVGFGSSNLYGRP